MSDRITLSPLQHEILIVVKALTIDGRPCVNPPLHGGDWRVPIRLKPPIPWAIVFAEFCRLDPVITPQLFTDESGPGFPTPLSFALDLAVEDLITIGCLQNEPCQELQAATRRKVVQHA